MKEELVKTAHCTSTGYLQNVNAKENGLAFSNKTEASLFDIWKSLLGHKNFTKNDDFFAIGGNAKLATDLISQLSRKLNATFEPGDIYSHSIFSALAEFIRIDQELKYWKERLKGISPLELSTDFSRPALQSTCSAAHFFSIEKQLTDDLQSLSENNNVTLLLALLAAFYVLLHRYSGQTDICVGVRENHGNQQEMQNLAGLLNTLPLRTEVQGDSCFVELSASLSCDLQEAHQHQQVPPEKLLEATLGGPHPGGTSPFQVVFVFDDSAAMHELQPGKPRISHEVYNHQPLKFDITFNISETADGLLGRVEFCPDLYKKETIERLVNHFDEILRSVIINPKEKVCRLQMLNEHEEQELIHGFNQTAVAYREDKNVVELFEQQVTISQESTAVIFADKKLTYNQLNARANKLARYLQRRGIVPGDLVPICIDRSPEMMVSILGILKSGAAYVPLDITYPIERIKLILEDTKATVACISKSLEKINGVENIALIEVDGADLDNESPENLGITISSASLAYVIYTSGSTGIPKGVMIEHRSLMNYLLYSQSKYITAQMGNSGTFLHLPYTFDASVTAIFTPLISGRSVVLASGNSLEVFEEANFRKYAPYDFIKITPSHLGLLESKLESAQGGFMTKRLVIGGEALQWGQLKHMQENAVDIEIINEYGPTEATVGCSVYSFQLLTEKARQGGSIPIGKPVSNTQIFILTEHLMLAPIGVWGELCIGGAGLARGYLNRYALTREKFITNPFSKEASSRIYRTGDLCRRLDDGNIEYGGRIDDQVKILGHRVEPGEIEALVAQSGLLSQAVVISEQDNNGNRRLIGYGVTKNGSAWDPETVRAYLRSQLPEYMVPAFWAQLPAIPLTANGKVDRRALPGFTSAFRSSKYLPPQNELEEILSQIWCDLLGLSTVGTEDNFFDLGGNSIIALHIINRLSKLRYRLQPRDIFVYHNIKKLAAFIETKINKSFSGRAESGTLTGASGILPAQQRCLERSQGNISHYSQFKLIAVRKAIEPKYLNAAIEQLLQFHDALRFKYSEKNGQWMQMYGDSRGELIVEDFYGSSPSMESAVRDQIWKHSQSLDVKKGELIRVVLLLTPAQEAENRLLIVMHELVTDSNSWMIFLNDFDFLLTNLAKYGSVSLGKKKTSHRQWHEFLHEYSSSQHLAGQTAYWIRIARQYEPFPTDRICKKKTQLSDIGQQTCQLESKETLKLLYDVSRCYQTDMNTILLSVLARTLTEWSLNEKLVIGIQNGGRDFISEEIDTSGTIGAFTWNYPIFLKIRKGISDHDLIRLVTEQSRELPDRGLGYAVLRYISKQKELQNTTNWDIAFEYKGQTDDLFKDKQNFSRGPEPREENHTRYGPMEEKLLIVCAIESGQLVVTWNYAQRHYEDRTVNRFATNYLLNLRMLIEHSRKQRAKFRADNASDSNDSSKAIYRTSTSLFSNLKDHEYSLTGKDNKPDSGKGNEESHIIPIQKEGSRRPIFVVDDFWIYRKLSFYLGTDQPFYCVQGSAYTSVGEIAFQYVQEVKRIQSHGPYIIGGFCAKGYIALEMARQLVASGESVAMLMLFEMYADTARTKKISSEFFSSRYKRLSGLSYKQLLHYLNKKAYSLLSGLFSIVVSGKKKAHQTDPYEGNVALFKASKVDPSFFRHETFKMGWSEVFTGNCQVFEIEGNHSEIFSEPGVSELAEKLRSLLEPEPVANS